MVHSVGLAQPATETDNDFEKIFKVGGDIIAQPTNFSSDDWIKLSATIGVTAVTSIVDKDIRRFSQSHKSTLANQLFQIDKYYHIEGITLSVAAIYGYGTLAEDKNFKNLGLKLSEATIYSGLIALIAKSIIGRNRPTIYDDQYVFFPFSFKYESTAFPSGHTALAFAYSTVMANEYNNFFWKFGWYSLSAMVGYARIYNDQHWLSDVLMGAALGYFVGEFVNNHETNQIDNSPEAIVPQPILHLKIPLSF